MRRTCSRWRRHRELCTSRYYEARNRSFAARQRYLEARAAWVEGRAAWAAARRYRIPDLFHVFDAQTTATQLHEHKERIPKVGDRFITPPGLNNRFPEREMEVINTFLLSDDEHGESRWNSWQRGLLVGGHTPRSYPPA